MQHPPSLLPHVAVQPATTTSFSPAVVELAATPEPQNLRDYMRANSLKGNKPMKARVPFIGEIIDYPSPFDAEVVFGIKRLPNRDVMAYRDKNSVVRFITEDNSERYIQEKDYPAGTMRVDTVLMGLATWNITDESGKAIDITRENILLYLDPEGELDAVYDKVLEINPILTGREKAKND